MQKSIFAVVIGVMICFIATTIQAKESPKEKERLTLKEWEKKLNTNQLWEATPGREVVVAEQCMFDSKKSGTRYMVLFVHFLPIVESGASVTENDAREEKNEAVLRYEVNYTQEEYRLECDENKKCRVIYYNQKHSQKFGYIVSLDNPMRDSYFIFTLGENEQFRPFEAHIQTLQPIPKEVWENHCGKLQPSPKGKGGTE